MRVLVCAAALLLSGCATSPTIGGRYAGVISQKDVEEISQLISLRSDIQRPVALIRAERPGSAKVYSGVVRNVGDLQTWFTVYRRDGKWHIDDSSIMRVKLVDAHLGPNQTTQRTAGRSEAASQIMKTPPFQATLAFASGG